MPAALVVEKATVTGVTVFEANAPVQVTVAFAAAPASVTDTLLIENTAVDGVAALLKVKVGLDEDSVADPQSVAVEVRLDSPPRDTTYELLVAVACGVTVNVATNTPPVAGTATPLVAPKS